MSEIESVLKEERTFAPSAEFRASAHIGSRAENDRMYRQSIDDPETFWDGVAKELPWMEPYSGVLDWSGKPVATLN